MKLDFNKYQGTGNDFIIVDSINKPLEISKEDIKYVCDRHLGIGSDGLIIVRSDEQAGYYMDFYNPDGTTAEMCGNGIRCLAAYVKEILKDDSMAIRVNTLAGIKTVTVTGSLYTVDMGEPSFKANDIPVLLKEEEAIEHRLETGNRSFKVTAVSMGNPHAVIFAEGEPLELAKTYGPLIEKDPIFPNKTNVEFVNLNSGRAKTVVWERGAGLTQACGTGACAVLAAAHRLGKAQKKLVIDLPGGSLNVEYDEKGSILMSGPAEFVFKGCIEV